jgi:hypothetical protein
MYLLGIPNVNANCKSVDGKFTNVNRNCAG